MARRLEIARSPDAGQYPDDFLDFCARADDRAGCGSRLTGALLKKEFCNDLNFRGEWSTVPRGVWFEALESYARRRQSLIGNPINYFKSILREINTELNLSAARAAVQPAPRPEPPPKFYVAPPPRTDPPSEATLRRLAGGVQSA